MEAIRHLRELDYEIEILTADRMLRVKIRAIMSNFVALGQIIAQIWQ